MWVQIISRSRLGPLAYVTPAKRTYFGSRPDLAQLSNHTGTCKSCLILTLTLNAVFGGAILGEIKAVFLLRGYNILPKRNYIAGSG